MLKALLKPEAKKPPNGAMRDANTASGKECSCAGNSHKDTPASCKKHFITTTHTRHTTHLVLLHNEQSWSLARSVILEAQNMHSAQHTALALTHMKPSYLART